MHPLWLSQVHFQLTRPYCRVVGGGGSLSLIPFSHFIKKLYIYSPFFREAAKPLLQFSGRSGRLFLFCFLSLICDSPEFSLTPIKWYGWFRERIFWLHFTIIFKMKLVARKLKECLKSYKVPKNTISQAFKICFRIRGKASFLLVRRNGN